MNPAGLFALFIALAASSSSSSASSSSASSDYHQTAIAYGRAKVPLLRARWNDRTVRQALERFAPHYLPGVPLEAALALGVSSTGPAENLGTAVGLWGVEQRRLDAWANDAETLEVLRRPYPARDGYARDLEAQVFTGLRRYAAAVVAAREALGREPSALGGWFAAAGEPLEPWEYQSAVAAYSSGEGTLSRLMRPAAVRAYLAARGKPERWPAAAAGVAAIGARGGTEVEGVPLRGIVGAAWTIQRPRERYEAAKALATELRRPLGWYREAAVSDATDRALAQWAHTP